MAFYEIIFSWSIYLLKKYIINKGKQFSSYSYLKRRKLYNYILLNDNSSNILFLLFKKVSGIQDNILDGGYFSQASRQLVYLFIEVIRCNQEHNKIFVQLDAYPFIVNWLWIFWNRRSDVILRNCRQIMRLTPPFLVRSIQGGLRRYAVRKGLVRSTQKFYYIVRRHRFLLLKRSSFHQETHHTWQTMSNNSKKFARSFRWRSLVISAFINLNIEVLL